MISLEFRIIFLDDLATLTYHILDYHVGLLTRKVGETFEVQKNIVEGHTISQRASIKLIRVTRTSMGTWATSMIKRNEIEILSANSLFHEYVCIPASVITTPQSGLWIP